MILPTGLNLQTLQKEIWLCTNLSSSYKHLHIHTRTHVCTNTPHLPFFLLIWKLSKKANTVPVVLCLLKVFKDFRLLEDVLEDVTEP